MLIKLSLLSGLTLVFGCCGLENIYTFDQTLKTKGYQ